MQTFNDEQSVPPSDVILFVKDGHLQSLEYVSCTSEPPLDWPDVEALQPA